MLKFLLLPFLIVSSFSVAVPDGGLVDATYTVPVPFEIASFATFKMPDSYATLNKDLLQVTYFLPREIVHKNLHLKPITLKGKIKRFPEHFEMVDGLNKAQCLLRKDGLTCLVSYEFTPDVEQVLEYIKTKYPPEEYDSRSMVVKTFGGEAGGIVHFPINLLE